MPGLADFLTLYTQMWAPRGKLAQRGLIAAPDDVRAAALREVELRTPMTVAGLH